jgi:hypothetical protein
VKAKRRECGRGIAGCEGRGSGGERFGEEQVKRRVCSVARLWTGPGAS